MTLFVFTFHFSVIRAHAFFFFLPCAKNCYIKVDWVPRPCQLFRAPQIKKKIARNFFWKYSEIFLIFIKNAHEI